MRQACAAAIRTNGKQTVWESGKPEGARLDEVFTVHMSRLYHAAYRLMRNPADSEDALQDGLLAAFRHIDQFRGDSNLSTWLHTIVTNAARMQLRKRNRRQEASIPDDSAETTNGRCGCSFVDRSLNPEQACARKERSRLLAKRVKNLSPDCRSAVQLCVIDGLLLREAAQKLGVPTGTVKARLHRARKRLAEQI